MKKKQEIQIDAKWKDHFFFVLAGSIRCVNILMTGKCSGLAFYRFNKSVGIFESLMVNIVLFCESCLVYSFVQSVETFEN